MKIEIDVPNERCKTLLDKFGFIEKDVMAYYIGENNPYNADAHNVNMLKPIKVKIAYDEENEPEEIKKEYPLLDNLKPFLYENVINELFNNLLFKRLLVF